jgi:hypothetical protein
VTENADMPDWCSAPAAPPRGAAIEFRRCGSRLNGGTKHNKKQHLIYSNASEIACRFEIQNIYIALQHK